MEHYTARYYEKMQRRGVSMNKAKLRMLDPNYVGLMMLECGDADGFISGVYSPYKEVFEKAKEVIGLQPCCKYAAGMHIATTKRGTYFWRIPRSTAILPPRPWVRDSACPRCREEL